MDAKEHWSRRELLEAMTAGGALIVLTAGRPARAAGGHDAPPTGEGKQGEHFWGYVIDTSRCIGCGACMRACRAENNVPDGRFRTWVERYRVFADGTVDVDVATEQPHVFTEPPTKPEQEHGEVVKAFFVPKMCNHCEKSACTQVCPVGASYHTDDGVVLVDQTRCVGCGYCVQACPYGTRFIHPETHVADKCTWCYHRITKGLLPACVQSCPKKARVFGDLNDPNSEISIILKQGRFQVLKPEMGTHPKCYYLSLDREVV